MRFLPPVSVLAVSVPFLAVACVSANVIPNPGGEGGGGGTQTDGPFIKLDGPAIRLPDAPSYRPSTDAPPGPNCGNGEKTQDEACDDGNTESGDGCANNCLSVETGYSCVEAGKPCRRVARCGDGVVVAPELCDDGNTNAGDGCSASCKIEIGYKCDGSPSKCTPTECGDNQIVGAEGCDDGNSMPFDGCSSDCQNEPACKGSSACTSRCGDGIVLNEDCDDGNNTDGDGCSKDCKTEKGFKCSQPKLGDKMLVPAVYRDFRYHKPTDFEGGVTGSEAASTGMVKNELDADGKPVFAGTNTGSAVHVESAASFSQWYRNTSGVNSATVGKMALWNNGKGAYVNRYKEDGTQWYNTEPAYYCGNVGAEKTDADGNIIPCTSKYATSTDCDTLAAKGEEMLPGSCTTNNGSYSARFIVARMDGNPLFFPVDGNPFTPTSELNFAQVPPLYDPAKTWPHDTDAKGKDILHNFSFTSEVRYWFKYETGKSYQLDFTGDDDVWVFINKKLAVDLGGIHTPVQGSVTLDGTTASKFGMTAGNVYEIAVFQAERQTTSSSYKLTLSGFNAAPSDCKPDCGDGELEIGEECDDGPQNGKGGYGSCGSDCRLTAGFCGDEVVQEGEDCDDGGKNGTDGYCPSGCHYLIPIL